MFPGSITFLQRFGSLLNLNLHLHILVLDGAYICRKGKRPFFHKIPDLSDGELGSLLDSIIEGVELCLRKRGLLEEGVSDLPVSEELVSVEAASQASLAQRIAFGERAGQRVRKIGLRQEGEMMESKGPQCIALSGFNLHAARHLQREDRQGLSQLVSYTGRPPLSMERLEEAGDGDLIYNLRHAWKDGTTGIKLSPSEIIEKLVALIPPPRSPLIRYSGVFAPNYSRRDEIILRPGLRKQKVRPPVEEAKAIPSKSVGEGSWARLLKRVFAADVSHCPRCVHALAIVAAVIDSFSIQRYLKHVGMPAAPPRIEDVQLKVLCVEWA